MLAKPGAAAELLASLTAVGDQAAHKAEVDKFFRACNARANSDAKGLMADVTARASHIRNHFRELRIAEFSETMTHDKLPDADSGGVWLGPGPGWPGHRVRAQRPHIFRDAGRGTTFARSGACENRPNIDVRSGSASIAEPSP